MLLTIQASKKIWACFLGMSNIKKEIQARRIKLEFL